MPIFETRDERRPQIIRHDTAHRWAMEGRTRTRNRVVVIRKLAPGETMPEDVTMGRSSRLRLWWRRFVCFGIWGFTRSRGQLLDALIHNGGVEVYPCRRDHRALRAFWIFVLAAIAGCAALAIFN